MSLGDKPVTKNWTDTSLDRPRGMSQKKRQGEVYRQYMQRYTEW